MKKHTRTPVTMLVVAAHEPSGKKLGECQKVSVLLTLDQPDDDDVRVAELDEQKHGRQAPPRSDAGPLRRALGSSPGSTGG